MTDYRAILYDPIYSAQGVPAVLTLTTGEVIDSLTALDKTAGVDTTTAFFHAHRLKPEVQTIKPGACLRVGELTDNGVSVDQLPNARLQMNGFVWNVTSYRMRPSPQGELDGEVLLILAGKTAADSESESGT